MASDSPSYIKLVAKLFGVIVGQKSDAGALKDAQADIDDAGVPFTTLDNEPLGTDMDEEESSGDAQQLGTALQELADGVGDGAGAGLTEEEVENLIRGIYGEPDASLWPFSYGIPYDLRRTTFELTSAGGVWVPYVGLTPVTGDVDWSTVTSIDFTVRDVEGVNRTAILSAPSLQRSSLAVGIRRDDGNTITVVAFETTGPVTFPGVTSTPFLNQNRTLHSGDVVPDTSIGINGDAYIKTDVDTVYVRVNDLWLSRTFDLRTDQGGAISTVTAQPAAGDGAEGDAAVILSTGQWWRKTDATTWTEQRGFKSPLDVSHMHSYATLPIRRINDPILNVGQTTNLNPPLTEYDIILVLPLLAEGVSTYPNIAGADGQDGMGVEYIFAVTANPTLSINQTPLNIWGFDEPKTVGGLTWHDGAPNVDENRPHLWRSARTVPGTPVVGTSIVDPWRTPVIVGHWGPDGAPGLDGIAGANGMDGVPGEDGLSYEYVFAATGGATLSQDQHPDNAWGFDEPGVVDTLQWHDDAAQISSVRPYLWRAQRRIEGAPPIGDSVSAIWSEPVIVSRWGADGQPGQPGLPGIAGADGTDGADGADGAGGADGTDGVGYEYIYAVLAGTTVPNNQFPLNDWEFENGGTRNGLSWSNVAPNVDATLQYLWRAQRIVIGTPSAGDAVPAIWSSPTIFSRYSAPGSQGPQGVPGQSGADGIGLEYLFSVTSADSLDTNQYPNDNWGFDVGGTSNGVTWGDAAPNLTAIGAVLWRTQRGITGQPTAGDVVTDTWDLPVVVGRFGQDGVDGANGVDGQAGADGRGLEFVFATTNSAILPDAQRPDNAWGYDSPVSVDGLAWHDGAPNVTATSQYLWRSQRAIEGTPTMGAFVADQWRVPVIVGSFGPPGADGAAGMDGMAGVAGVAGMAGMAGVGVEYVFAVINVATLPQSQRPNDNWGFDQPGISNGLQWHDGAPVLSDTLQYLWRSQRRVHGLPADGTAVMDSWRPPVIVGRFGPAGIQGIQGITGADGDDGEGLEGIYAIWNEDDLVLSQYPRNDWGYLSPMTTSLANRKYRVRAINQNGLRSNPSTEVSP